MNYKIPMKKLPKTLEISEVLTEHEKPQVQMKNIILKIVKKENVGAAFHEKSEKNKKVNVRRNHDAEMKKKYGKAYRKGVDKS